MNTIQLPKWWRIFAALVIAAAFNLITQPQTLGSLSGLVGRWQFDEGSGVAAADSSGYGNHGRLLDGPQWQATPFRPVALLFNGVRAHVGVGNSPSLNPINQITLAAWIAPFDVSASGEIIAKSSGTDQQYSLRVQRGGKLRFVISGAVLDGNLTLLPGDWHLVAGVYDGSTMKIYVDGALDVTMSRSGPMHDNGVDVWIGCRRFQTPLAFNGLIDDPQIYNRALSASEIQSLGNLRTANDDFANSFDLAQIATGNNVNATLEPGELDDFQGEPTAGHSVWWHWTAPSDGIAVISTEGSSFETVVVVYAGPFGLRQILGSGRNMTYFDARAGGTVSISVDGGAAGEWGSIQLSVHYGVPPTVNLIQPHDGDTIPFGTPIDMEATAQDSDGFVTRVVFSAYDPEQFLEHQFPDSISPYLVTWTPPHPGQYQIWARAVDNDDLIGSMSRIATLNVVTPPPSVPPVNDNFANSFDLAQITTGNNVNATLESGEPDHNHGQPTAGHSVWWHWTAPRDGWTTITTVGSSFETRMAIYTGNTVPGLQQVESIGSYDYPQGNTHLLFPHTAGTTYRIAVDGVPGAWGDIQLGVNAEPTVSLTSPSNGDFFPFGQPVHLAAVANDPDGFVSEVLFDIDDGAQQFRVSQSPFEFDWTPLTHGRHRVTAVAKDNTGDTYVRADDVIIVVGMTISLTSPINGDVFGAGTPVHLAAAADDPDGTVSEVGFLIRNNARVFQFPVYSAPYKFDWTPDTPGQYEVMAYMIDIDGGWLGTSWITISVQ